MRPTSNISIYIDNTGHDDDREFGDLLKTLILNLNIATPYEVRTFTDLRPGLDSDPNNEVHTQQAINEATIVIPIISTNYVNYVTPSIEKAINRVIDSADRYLFPVFLDQADWSNHDWVVKSHVTPQDAKPLSNFNNSDKQKIVSELVATIKSVIVNRNQADLSSRNISSSINHSAGNLVFISHDHDHDDADFAELLKLKLEKEGIVSWLDTERLKVGQDWREEIDQGIKDCLAVIAIMTPESRKSEYVTYEWAFAWGKDSKRHNNHTLRYGSCSDQYGSSLANASDVFAVGSCSNSCVR